MVCFRGGNGILNPVSYTMDQDESQKVENTVYTVCIFDTMHLVNVMLYSENIFFGQNGRTENQESCFDLCKKV